MAVAKDLRGREYDKFDTDGAVRISGEITTVANPLDKYSTQAIDEVSASITYIGKESTAGVWLLQELEEIGTVTTIKYANIGNNATRTTYTLAWDNRATLTYDILENLTDV